MSVEQHPRPVAKPFGEQKPWHPAARAEIERRAIRTHLHDGLGKMFRRGDVSLEWTGTEKAESPGLGQGSQHRFGNETGHVRVASYDPFSGSNTTLRRGSSP